MSVLVVAAHPDDETFGMGATISRLTQNGTDVHVVALADGVMSRSCGPMEIYTRQQAGLAAAKVLGCSMSFEGLPDQQLDARPLLDISQRIEKWVNLLKPKVVYTHFAGDLNQDHAAAARATLVACRPGRSVLRVLSYYVPSATEWGFGQWGVWQPNVYSLVSQDDMSRRVQATDCYAGEQGGEYNPRRVSVLHPEILGSVVQQPLAEAFLQVWGVE